MTNPANLPGRPKTDEYDAYYERYISLVSSADILAALGHQILQTRVLVSKLDGDYRYAPEKWSIRQVLNHVSDTERAFAFRALWFARGFEEPLPGFDQNIAAAGAEADGISWAAHIEEFRSVRLATISLLRNMPPEAWERRGVASGNPFTVRAVAYIIAGHVEHHIGVVRQRYL